MLLGFTSLHVLEDIDVTFVCRNQEVTVIDENENIQDLLPEVHNVPELGNQVSSHVLSLHFLILDKVPHNVETLKLITVVLQRKQRHLLDFVRSFLLIKLAVAQPDAQIVLRADLDHVCIVLLGLLHELGFEFHVINVSCNHYCQYSFFLDALDHFIAAFDNASRFLLRANQFVNCLDSLVHSLLIDLFLNSCARICAVRGSTVKPVETDRGFVETDGGCVAKFIWALASAGVLALRPCDDYATFLVDFHALDPGDYGLE